MKRTKQPCNECPFRRHSIAGWLGPWSPMGIVQQAHAETGLACHMNIGQNIDQLSPGERQNMLNDGTLKICSGALINANKSCKRYRNPALAELQDDVAAAENAENMAEEVMDVREFLAHHGEADERVWSLEEVADHISEGLPQWQREANLEWLKGIHRMLADDGVWGHPNFLAIWKKRGDGFVRVI